MSRKSLASGAIALALFAATPSWAASDADLAQIRDEIRQLRENYEARIQSLEARLKDAVAAAAKPGASAPPPEAAAPPGADPPGSAVPDLGQRATCTWPRTGTFSTAMDSMVSASQRSWLSCPCA